MSTFRLQVNFCWLRSLSGVDWSSVKLNFKIRILCLKLYFPNSCPTMQNFCSIQTLHSCPCKDHHQNQSTQPPILIHYESIHPSTHCHQPSTHPASQPSIHFVILEFIIFVKYLFIHTSVSSSTLIIIHLPFHQSIQTSIHPFIHLFIYPSTHPFCHSSIHLPYLTQIRTN